ncbi:MAG TPA: hypothetical protein VF543_10025 [Pyrinomonadaceae bacterium]|jgi:hypothetical protein
MNAYDLVGLAILLLIILGAVYGLHRITKPVEYTKEVYEERLRKGTGIARGAMNAMMYPVEELLNPKAVEAVHVKKDIRAGYYDVQQENGEGQYEQDSVLSQEDERNTRELEKRRERPRLLQRFLNLFRFQR